MNESFTPYNPFAYLDSAESLKNYWLEVIFDENPQVFLTALSFAIQYYGAANMARQSGLNRESLYKIIHQQRKPSFDTLHRLLLTLSQPPQSASS